MTRADLDRIAPWLVTLALERVALQSLVAAAHALADADTISVSDAFYVALARLRRIELVTADAHLERAAAGLAKVRLIDGRDLDSTRAPL